MKVKQTIDRLLQAIPRKALAAGTAAAALVAAGPALAAPAPWEVYLQEAVTPIAQMVHSFNFAIQILIGVIVLFVLVLLVWVMIRYNAKSNPTPSRTSHNTLVEVVWTVVPVLILVAIAIPSFNLLFAQYNPARAIEGYDPEKTPPLTIKVTGFQWYWNYEYVDNGDVAFDSVMLGDADRKDPVKQPRLLAVDNQFIVPVGQVVRLQVTAADVIHSWAMQPFGVKTDAVPGRLNETWFRVDKPGVYYGQCSELCGKDHAFMPIELVAVPQDKFKAWVAAAKGDLKGAYKSLQASLEKDGSPVALASR